MKSPEERIRELINLTKALRAEGGCPWDRKQTFLSLRNYIIEEAYEVVDAISRNDIDNLKEEVGDLLLQVLFITNIAEEESMFTFEDVILELSDKLSSMLAYVFCSSCSSCLISSGIVTNNCSLNLIFFFLGN